MGYDGVAVGERMCHKIVICNLQECIDCNRLILLASGPTANTPQGGYDCRIRSKEEVIASLCSPFRKLVPSSINFCTNALNAKDTTGCIAGYEPLPKAWAKIKAVMKILGLDENIGIKQVGHALPPSCGQVH